MSIARSTRGVSNYKNFKKSVWARVGYKGQGKNIPYVHYLQQHYHSRSKGENLFNNVNSLFSSISKKQAIEDYTKGMNSNIVSQGMNVISDTNMLTELDNAIGEEFKKILNFDREAALIQYQTSFGGTVKDLGDTFITIQKDFKQIFSFLEQINEIVQLMQKGTNINTNISFYTLLSKACQAGGQVKNPNLEKILNEIQKYLKANEGAIIDTPHYKESLNFYYQMISKLKQLTTTNKDVYSIAASFNPLLKQNFMSKGLGQATAFKIDSLVERNLQDLEQVMTGNKTTKNTEYKQQNQKNTYKTDLSFKNQYLELSTSEKQINVNLNLSVKFYQKQNFFAQGNKKLSFDSGSGGSLQEFFHSISLNDITSYELYNYLTFCGLTGPVFKAILRRHFFRLFATGSNQLNDKNVDFSSHILANGELISLWQVYNFIQKQFSSMDAKKLSQYINVYFDRKNGKGGSLKSIKLNENWMFKNQWKTVNGNKKTPSPDTANYQAAWKRVRLLIDDINKATIHATMHLHKIVQLYSMQQEKQS